MPYTLAASFSEFNSWPIEKKKAIELQRATAVRMHIQKHYPCSTTTLSSVTPSSSSSSYPLSTPIVHSLTTKHVLLWFEYRAQFPPDKSATKTTSIASRAAGSNSSLSTPVWNFLSPSRLFHLLKDQQHSNSFKQDSKLAPNPYYNQDSADENKLEHKVICNFCGLLHEHSMEHGGGVDHNTEMLGEEGHKPVDSLAAVCAQKRSILLKSSSRNNDYDSDLGSNGGVVLSSLSSAQTLIHTLSSEYNDKKSLQISEGKLVGLWNHLSLIFKQ